MPYDDPVAHDLVERVQQEYVAALRRPRRAPSSTPPSSCRRAGMFLVAEVDGVPAGCGAWRVHARGVVEIKRVYVEPAFRRRGLAQLIMAALEETAARGRAPGGRAEHRRRGSPRRWRSTPALGYRARAGVRDLRRRRPMRGFLGKELVRARGDDRGDGDEEERPWAS